MAQRKVIVWAEKKILCIDLDGEDETWHQRALLVELDKGKWIAATPDEGLEVVDLAKHQVIPLKQNEVLPPRVRRDCYAFDPLREEQKKQLELDAVDLAETLGHSAAAPSAGVWRVADTASDRFGERDCGVRCEWRVYRGDQRR